MAHSTLARIGSLGWLLALGLQACAADAKPDETAAVVRQYALLLHANYEATISKLEALKSSVDAFVAAPSEEGLTAARDAWLASRTPYGESEFSRFYGGPMDAAQGAMNEWPIDENYIDYTAGNPNGGMINALRQFPEVSAPVLAAATGKGGTENLSTGFHAIEFLLWGQRLDQTAGPGERPYTDYVDGGTAMNQDRRRLYLQAAAHLLLEDMRAVDAEWNLDDPKSYAATFLAAKPRDSLTKIYRGFSQMAISEVLYERLSNPFRSRDRKDEESCFSESTRTDLIANAHGVENVYLGHYGSVQGPSLSDLIAAKDQKLDARMRQQLAAIRKAIDAIPDPFDHAVLADPSSDENRKVKAAIDTCTLVLDTLKAGSTTLGIVNNL